MTFTIICGECAKSTVFDQRYDETNGNEYQVSLDADYDGNITIQCDCGNKKNI